MAQEQTSDDFDPHAVFQRFREVRCEWVDDTLFIIDAEEKAIHGLDRLSAAIWELLLEPWSADGAGRLVAQAYPGQPLEDVLDDVEQVFADLESYNLISIVR
jgi:hypothetical protein